MEKNGQQRTFLASLKANHHSSSATDWPNKCVCRQGFQTPPGQWSLGFTKWVANRSHKPSCWFGPRQHNKSYKSKPKVASGTLSKLVYSLRWQGKLESILHCQRHLEHGRTPERMEWHFTSTSRSYRIIRNIVSTCINIIYYIYMICVCSV